MKKILSLFFVVISCSLLSAEQAKTVEAINKAVSSMDDSINAGQYMLFQCEDIEPTEGMPPRLKFYYKGEQLVAIISEAGHESWSNEFRYYYYANGSLMKYLKITKGQTNTPVRAGIIYDLNGSILWKNIDAPVIDGKILSNLFKTFQNYRIELSKY